MAIASLRSIFALKPPLTHCSAAPLPARSPFLMRWRPVSAAAMAPRPTSIGVVMTKAVVRFPRSTAFPLCRSQNGHRIAFVAGTFPIQQCFSGAGPTGWTPPITMHSILRGLLSESYHSALEVLSQSGQSGSTTRTRVWLPPTLDPRDECAIAAGACPPLEIRVP